MGRQDESKALGVPDVIIVGDVDAEMEADLIGDEAELGKVFGGWRFCFKLNFLATRCAQFLVIVGIFNLIFSFFVAVGFFDGGVCFSQTELFEFLINISVHEGDESIHDEMIEYEHINRREF